MTTMTVITTMTTVTQDLEDANPFGSKHLPYTNEKDPLFGTESTPS